MRSTRVILVAAVGILLAVAAAGAAPTGWHESGAPEGGEVFALERGPDGTFYAGTRSGLFRSTDGKTWQHGGAFPGVAEDDGVTAIDAPVGSTVYAVVGESRLFRSTNAGASWESTGEGIDPQAQVISVAGGRGDSHIVYAGTTNWFSRVRASRIYRSSDGGQTWTSTSYGREEGDQPAVILVDREDPRTVYVGTSTGKTFAEDEVSSGGVYKTDNGGETWMPLHVGLPLEAWVISLAVDPRGSGTIYAGTEANGVFKSTDGGLRWRRARSGLARYEEESAYLSVNDLVVDPADPNVVYAATDSGLATTVDGGAYWQAKSGSDLPGFSALLMDPTSPGTLLAGSENRGVLRSFNSGATWAADNTGLTALSVMAIAVDPTAPPTVYLGTYKAGLFVTSSGGATWSQVAGLPPGTVRSLAINPKTHETLYAGVDDRGVLKSIDGGKTWNPTGHGIPTEYAQPDAIAIDPRRPSTVYAVDDGGLYKTVDAGSTWKTLRITGWADADVNAIAVDPSRSATIYASADYSRGVAVSKNGGKTWIRVVAGLHRNAGIYRIVVAPRTGVVYAAGDTVYRMPWDGKRLTPTGAGLPRDADGKVAEIRSFAVNPRTGAACAGTNVGLYELARKNGTLRWRIADPSLAGRTIRRLAFAADGSRLYAATPGRLLVSR